MTKNRGAETMFRKFAIALFAIAALAGCGHSAAGHSAGPAHSKNAGAAAFKPVNTSHKAGEKNLPAGTAVTVTGIIHGSFAVGAPKTLTKLTAGHVIGFHVSACLADDSGNDVDLSEVAWELESAPDLESMDYYQKQLAGFPRYDGLTAPAAGGCVSGWLMFAVPNGAELADLRYGGADIPATSWKL